MKSVSFEFGGNKRFFDFIKEYNIQSQTIQQKYSHKATKYYMKKHQAVLDGLEQKDLPPAKDWGERFDRMKTSIKTTTNKVERGFIENIDKIDKKVEEKGWKNKVSTFI